MIEQLKQMYKKYMISDLSATNTPEKYIWYQTEDGPIGFKKSALSEKEITLIGLLLPSYMPREDLTGEASFWHDILFKKNFSETERKQNRASFRLIHFYIKDPSIDVAAFSEAVNGLFPEKTVLLWESEQQGVLVEPEPSDFDEATSYEDFVDTLTSDFYTDIWLYVGVRQTDLSAAKKQFRYEKKALSICHRFFSSRSVFYHHEQIPFLLLYHAPSSERHEMFHHLLEKMEGDHELLNSIREYLTCNMNITMAAKNLFIHRNSLQYRVEKFTEQTNLDVKKFPEAVTVYLALLEKPLSDESSE